MSVSTTLPAARRHPHSVRARARKAIAESARQAKRAASEARRRYRRPSLVISSLGCIDASAWTTFGLGAGLLALGISLFVFEMLGSDE